MKTTTFDETLFTYGDDSWVLAGSNYTNFFDKALCCAFSQLGFSLFFQNLFLLSPSTDIYIKLLFFIFCFSSALVINNKNLNLNIYEKIIFLMLIFNSPMLMNYSLRSKPFVFESLLTIFILGLLFKTNSLNKFEIKTLLYFSIFIFFSLTTIIPIASFFIILLRKRKFKLRGNIFFYSLFATFTAGISFLSFLKKNSEIDSGWIAYYAPTEGGISLFFRWLYFSVLRIFTESNKLDLGASGFTTFISIFLFLLGVYYLLVIKKNYLVFEFCSYIFLLNISLSLLKIYTFGGSRANIYYMPLVIYFMTMGVVFLIDKIPFRQDLLTISFILYLLFSINTLETSYDKTIRSFNQQAAGEIIQFVNTSNEEIIIYHGGLWTIGTYYFEKIQLENLDFPFEGSGTNNMPVPEFTKDNHKVVCTEYIEENNCFNKVNLFLQKSTTNTIYLASIHYRNHQLEEYIRAFDSNGFHKEVIIKGQEAELLKFSRKTK